MKNYYRVMLGKGSAHAAKAVGGGFIGADFGIAEDLSGKLPGTWREFSAAYVPVWLAAHPDKGKPSAAQSCGFLWTIAKGIKKGDVILSPDGTGAYRVAEVSGDYQYVPGQVLPHRRAVNWLPDAIDRTSFTEAFRNSAGSIGTVSTVTKYAAEIEALIGPGVPPPLIASDPEVEDPATFALEKHLEDFLVGNWARTDLGKLYDIFTEDGEKAGRQYQTDTGPIDILAVRKDKSELLVIELKKGRATDAVVGQAMRNMGYVKEELAEANQSVRGVIIASEDDPKLRRALAVAPNIEFYRYEVQFKLVKAQP
jgi:restriction system protein